MTRRDRRRGFLMIVLAGWFAASAPAFGQFVRPQKQKSSPPAVRKKQPKPVGPTKTASRSTPSAATSELHDALRVQLALEREGFSPGLIDGAVGRKTRVALAAWQAFNGREPTGETDDATRQLLKLDGTEPTRVYVLRDADAARVGPCPTDWIERSKADRLPFPTLLDVVAYEGHCSTKLIYTLNPGLRDGELRVGSSVVIPNVPKPARMPSVDHLEVDFGAKFIRCVDGRGRAAALFHCSIARQRTDRPQSDCRINTVAINPQYTFRPESWPEVKGIDRVLTIPPGPRNPVGLCWIDLSLDGYGIHGTPEPEMIGKTGSHGCIRMTNWDVLRLADMVYPGMAVRFVDSEERVADGTGGNES